MRWSVRRRGDSLGGFSRDQAKLELRRQRLQHGRVHSASLVVRTGHAERGVANAVKTTSRTWPSRVQGDGETGRGRKKEERERERDWGC